MTCTKLPVRKPVAHAAIKELLLVDLLPKLIDGFLYYIFYFLCIISAK